MINEKHTIFPSINSDHNKHSLSFFSFFILPNISRFDPERFRPKASARGARILTLSKMTSLWSHRKYLTWGCLHKRSLKMFS